MAKQLDEFPDGLKVGRPDKYPWDGDDGWLNGKPWEVEMGSDFFTSLESFKQTAKSAGKTRGGAVRVAKVDDKHLIIQFVKKN